MIALRRKQDAFYQLLGPNRNKVISKPSDPDNRWSSVNIGYRLSNRPFWSVKCSAAPLTSTSGIRSPCPFLSQTSINVPVLVLLLIIQTVFALNYAIRVQVETRHQWCYFLSTGAHLVFPPTQGQDRTHSNVKLPLDKSSESDWYVFFKQSSHFKHLCMQQIKQVKWNAVARLLAQRCD
jgi:hypothetical protein